MLRFVVNQLVHICKNKRTNRKDKEKDNKSENHNTIKQNKTKRQFFWSASRFCSDSNVIVVGKKSFGFCFNFFWPIMSHNSAQPWKNSSKLRTVDYRTLDGKEPILYNT